MGSIKYLSTTLKQYKECYSGLLERHKLEYADHNEFTFINSELESFWDKFIDINDIEELPFQFKFTAGYTDEELSNALADQKEFRDIAIKSNLSSSLIINFLETRKQELEKESNLKFSSHENDKKTILILEDIALKLAWEDANVTRENANDFLIGTKYQSGEKLYNHFIHYRNSTDRRSDPQSKVKLKNKIRRFEKVIKVLDDKFKPQAEDELKKIKTYRLRY